MYKGPTTDVGIYLWSKSRNGTMADGREDTVGNQTAGPGVLAAWVKGLRDALIIQAFATLNKHSFVSTLEHEKIYYSKFCITIRRSPTAIRFARPRQPPPPLHCASVARISI